MQVCRDTYPTCPLDIFRVCMHNKNIETQLDAWLTFFSSDDPATIVQLITEYPEFKPMYETLYRTCLDMEKDMVDTLSAEVDTLTQQKEVLSKENEALSKDNEILKQKLAELEAQLSKEDIVKTVDENLPL